MSNEKERGITLIALVITIIILLILAGVTLSLIWNGGIIDKSQKAVDEYAKVQNNEMEILDYVQTQFEIYAEGKIANGFSSGDGTEENPYVIRTGAQLAYLAKRVNEGYNFAGEYIVLNNDIDLSKICYRVDGKVGNDISWNPIGITGAKFAGNFNGNYHTISNLYINNNKNERESLFYETDARATIQNVIMSNVYVKNTYGMQNTNTFASALVAFPFGDIINCGIESGEIYSEKTIAEADSAGWRGAYSAGIAAYSANGKISNCFNKASIKAICPNANKNQAIAAGIAGEGYNVENCYNVGSVYTKGYETKTGGIVGETVNATIIKKCYNVGNISIENTRGADYYYGGLIGRNNKTTDKVNQNCYCIDNISCSQFYRNEDNTLFIKDESNIVTGDVLKTYASTINAEAYTNDVLQNGNYKYNNGYPILKWQIPENR